MKNNRPWLFRILVLASVGLLLYSWFTPWWAGRIQELGGKGVVIHPWGLQVTDRHMLDYMPPEVNLAMPGWFAPVAWAYLGLIIAALSFSLFAKDKALDVWKVRFTLPSLIIGAVGLSYIVAIITAAAVITVRLADADLPLIGRTFVTVGSDIGTGMVSTDLGLGSKLAAAAGLMLIVLALLRDRITHIR